MKMTNLKKALSLLLCALMLAAALLVISGCDKKEVGGDSLVTSSATQVEATELGDGDKQFDFTVKFVDGSSKAYKIRTDKETVGEALLDLGLIDGEDGAYGLYVKTVCDVTLDYDKDKKYWAFYENGEYASKGVDQTEITDGVIYEFRAE